MSDVKKILEQWAFVSLGNCKILKCAWSVSGLMNNTKPIGELKVVELQLEIVNIN